MTASQHDTTAGVLANPNQDVITGLLAVAAWLDAHPELPKAHYALVSLRSEYVPQTDDARVTLSTVAAALVDWLDDDVVERDNVGTITVEGKFGGARVIAAARKSELIDEPPVPEYEPILPVRS